MLTIKELPKSLKDITLQKWVEWDSTYGKDLIKRSRKKNQTDDERLLFEADFHCQHYAWYSDTPLQEVLDATNCENSQIVEVVKEAELSNAMLFREMCDIGNLDLVNTVFPFGDITLKIVAPVIVNAGEKMTVAEFEKMQDIALIFSDLQDGKIEAMYELCATYLQKCAEVDGVKRVLNFSDEATIAWVKSLPLFIALCVKRYVADTINLYKTLSHDRAATTSG